jgi:hypothetical protein
MNSQTAVYPSSLRDALPENTPPTTHIRTGLKSQRPWKWRGNFSHMHIHIAELIHQVGQRTQYRKFPCASDLHTGDYSLNPVLFQELDRREIQHTRSICFAIKPNTNLDPPRISHALRKSCQTPRILHVQLAIHCRNTRTHSYQAQRNIHMACS